MTKKIFIKLSAIIVVFLCYSLTACYNENEYNEYKVTYLTTDGGYIEGVTEQTIENGTNATSVTAIANEGYKFVKWADGVLTAERTDENIICDLTVTAIFVKMAKNYKYVYNNATKNNAIQSVYIDYKNIYDVKLPIPQRINSIFEGWYLEKDFRTQVSDADGNIVIDNNIFDSDSESLYAKFSLIKDATYKILMVYVTEIEGTFDVDRRNLSSDESILGQPIAKSIYIHHKMSDIDIKICSLITKKFKEKLNDIFAGLVNFEVDEYFTKDIVTNDNFNLSLSAFGIEYALFADDIPEFTDDFLDKYDCVMTTVQLTDIDELPPSLLHSGSGGAIAKYGCVFWENVVGPAIVNNMPLESLLPGAPNEYYIEEVIPGYLHEYIHTIETLTDFGFVYHDVAVHMGQLGITSEEEEHAELVLLNKAYYNGKTVGIPYEFWLDEFYLNVAFTASEGGTIIGNQNQRVKLGRNTETVVALPDFGYRFVGWDVNGSGIEYTEAELTVEIWRNREYIGIFQEITQAITYVGIIDNVIDPDFFKGESVSLKDFLETGLWFPQKDGYEFEGWYFDINFTLPFGDKYGNVTEEDYKIFDNEQFGNSVSLYGKFSKKE